MAVECPHCGETLERLVGFCPRCRGDLAVTDAVDKLIGQLIADNFELLSVIGAGAMGRVYRARQVSLDKIVAIKLLHPHLASDPKLAKRFHREARAASRLNHPNSVQIIDFGQDEGGRLFIAMEHLEGVSLSTLIQTDFPFAPVRIGRILGQVCDVLEEAHAAAIIHRDLKPDNVIISERRGEPDHVKVCDFGIAKIQDPKADGTDAALTMAGLVCGTPEYMSPEQARGDELDGRSDVYALGVIGYQMLCGDVPFAAQTALGVITKHLTDTPVPPSERRPDLGIPTAFENVFLKALAKDREDRQPSARELGREVAVVVAELVGPTVRPSSGSLPAIAKPATLLSGEIAAAPRRRGKSVLWGTIAGALLGVAGVALFALGGGGASTGGSQVEHVASGATAGGAHNPAGLAAADDGAAASAPDAGPVAIVPDAGHEEAAPDAAVEVTVPVGPGKRTKVVKAQSPLDNPTNGVPEPSPGRRAYEDARVLFLGGQYAQAISKYREAERLGFGGPMLYKSLGQAYSRVGNTAAMCDAYRRVLRASPNDLTAAGIVNGQCR